MGSVPQAGAWRTGKVERPERAEQRAAGRLYLIGEASDQELPDTRITEEDRSLVRRLVALFEPAMSAELLMHVSCGVEAAARRKRAAERNLA
jgi:hypothetical protein